MIFPRLRSWWAALSGRRRFEADLDEELRFHLESRARDLAGPEGLPPDAALRRARIELGSVDGYKEEVRQAHGLRLWDELVADLRFAWRGWRRHKALALAVTAILTVGIGLTTAVFTVVNAAVLRPQIGPPGDPGSFAKVFVAHDRPPDTDDFDPPQIQDLLELQAATRTLEHVAGARWVSARLGGSAVDVKGLLVTCNIFSVYRPAWPLMGRLLDARDCAEGAPVMVLGEALWRQLGADPALVGRVMSYKQHPFTVIGVVSGRFDAVREDNNVWLPYNHGHMWPVARSWESRFDTAARLRPGYSRREAAAELNVLLRQQDVRHPGRRSRVVVTDGSIAARPSDGKTVMVLSVLFGLLGMVVLLVSANVVTLLLARAHARRHEIAVRLALGAGRRRLMKMLLVETLPLAALAGCFSVFIAWVAPPILVRWLDDNPRDVPLDPDWRVWLFVGVVSLLAALASGLTPALESLGGDVMDPLKGGRRRSLPGGARRPLRDLLIAVQIMVSVVLMSGAALFVRGYVRIAYEDPGFDSGHTLMASLRPTGDDPAVWSVVHQAVTAELRATPGIEAVALAEWAPPGGRHLNVGRIGTASPGSPRPSQLNRVSPSFFETLRLPVLRGRALEARDGARGSVINVVIARRLARQLWPEEDPIGQILLGSLGERLQVVGVAGDIVRPGRTDEPAIYAPLGDHQAMVLARFAGDPSAAVARVDAAVRRAAPSLHPGVRTFQARYQKDADQLGRITLMVLGFGGVALTIALVGLYGSVSFSARRRLKEIGIRVALGARDLDVVKALVLPTARAVVLGTLAGTVLAIIMAPGLRPLTGDLDYRDPLTHASAALLLASAALAAMLGPAHRALGADPARVLRED